MNADSVVLLGILNNMITSFRELQERYLALLRKAECAELELTAAKRKYLAEIPLSVSAYEVDYAAKSGGQFVFQTKHGSSVSMYLTHTAAMDVVQHNKSKFIFSIHREETAKGAT